MTGTLYKSLKRMQKGRRRNNVLQNRSGRKPSSRGNERELVFPWSILSREPLPRESI